MQQLIGQNNYGELGRGTKTNSSTYYGLDKIKITENIKFKNVAAGQNHIIALDENDNIWTWGKNNGGQLGNGSRGEYEDEAHMISW